QVQRRADHLDADIGRERHRDLDEARPPLRSWFLRGDPRLASTPGRRLVAYRRPGLATCLAIEDILPFLQRVQIHARLGSELSKGQVTAAQLFDALFPDGARLGFLSFHSRHISQRFADVSMTGWWNA